MIIFCVEEKKDSLQYRGSEDSALIFAFLRWGSKICTNKHTFQLAKASILIPNRFKKLFSTNFTPVEAELSLQYC